MNITIENKKAKAIELMKKLDIYKPYIKGFEKDNTVCFSSNALIFSTSSGSCQAQNPPKFS